MFTFYQQLDCNIPHNRWKEQKENNNKYKGLKEKEVMLHVQE